MTGRLLEHHKKHDDDDDDEEHDHDKKDKKHQEKTHHNRAPWYASVYGFVNGFVDTTFGSETQNATICNSNLTMLFN